ncbi:MAG: universal stress protein [Rubrivivax sp.]
MSTVCACLDGLANSTAVVDCAVWSARRLQVPVSFLHMLERHPECAAVSDHSGAIGLGAQESLLGELAELDAQRGQLAQQAGRALLAAACDRAAAAGLAEPEVDTRLRHGSLVEGVLEVQDDARLFVMGEHLRPRETAAVGQSSLRARLHLDHHVEAVVRAVTRPVLVVPGGRFVAPQRVVIAFDGSATAHKTVQTVIRSPLLTGLPVLLAMATGSDAAVARPAAAQALDDPCRSLVLAGFDTRSEQLAGEPEVVLPALLKAQGAAWLVMGAYGHSRIRLLIVGSTTTALLRLAEVPVLVLH